MCVYTDRLNQVYKKIIARKLCCLEKIRKLLSGRKTKGNKTKYQYTNNWEHTEMFFHNSNTHIQVTDMVHIYTYQHVYVQDNYVL